MSKSEIKENTYQSGDAEIFYRSLTDEKNKKLLLLAHGLGEHSGRYEHVMQYFGGLGFDVYANDHRGHGQSSGNRGHIMSFDEYLDDFNEMRRIAEKEKKYDTLVVCGHSMGGLIAIRYVEKFGEGVEVLITSGAFVELTVKVPIYKLIPGKMLSNITPKLSMPSGLDSTAVCTDSNVVAAYENDPLVHDKVSARWFTEMVKSHDQARWQVGKLSLPVLMLHGEGDRLVGVSASRNFFPMLPNSDKKLITYPGFFHEIFNEPEQGRVFEDIRVWLAEHDLA